MQPEFAARLVVAEQEEDEGAGVEQEGAMHQRVMNVAVALIEVPGELGVQALIVVQRLVTEAHTQGLLVRAWNTSKEEDMRRLINFGVDAIGSDRPDVLIDVCRQAGVR